MRVGLIALPASLVESGLSANELTYRLADAINDLKQAGRPEDGQGVFGVFALEADLIAPDIEVPGAGLSLRRVLEVIDAVLSLRHRRVMSEVSARSGRKDQPDSTRAWLFTARIPGYAAHQIAFSPADPEPALRWMARELLGDAEPVILVRALLDIDCDEARVRARRHVLRSVSATELSRLYNAVGLAAECPSTEGEPGNNAEPDYGEATRFYHQAIDSDAGNVLPRINLARMRILRGDTSATAEAIADLEAAATQRPELAQTHEAWGVALHWLERHKEAIPHLEQATQLEPRSAFGYLYLAKARMALGDTVPALEAFALALVRDPNNVKVLRDYGNELYESGDFVGASAAFGRAVRIDTTDLRTQVRLARSLERAGRPAAACVYQRVMRLATPGDVYYVDASAALRLLERIGWGTCKVGRS